MKVNVGDLGHWDAQLAQVMSRVATARTLIRRVLNNGAPSIMTLGFSEDALAHSRDDIDKVMYGLRQAMLSAEEA